MLRMIRIVFFDKELSILIINEDYFEFIQQNLIITPISLPMLCQPNL